MCVFGFVGVCFVLRMYNMYLENNIIQINNLSMFHIGFKFHLRPVPVCMLLCDVPFLHYELHHNYICYMRVTI